MTRASLVYALIAAGLVSGLVASTGTSANSAVAPTATAEGPVSAKESHVVHVYYFHTTQRCASCRKIEAFSDAAIREGFDRELAAGTLEWQPVNTDERLNRHFIQDYQLYTKSLVVVDVVNGRRVRWKNLPKIWELLQDEKAFRQYVQGEVRDYLERRS